MTNIVNNILPDSGLKVDDEIFEDLLKHKAVRIERIHSKGHTSPCNGWYDQDENEWVIVIEGAGSIAFEDGTEVTLKHGDYLNIPAHTKHKVTWTSPDEITTWLAIFY